MKEKKKNISFVERVKLIHQAGLEGKSEPSNSKKHTDNLESLRKRIRIILNIKNQKHIKPENMLYFIMYDIQNNKIRTLIAKYLLNKGCQRVQKSIFFSESSRSIYNDIVKDLKKVQETYSNEDSIFFVPVSTGQLSAMKVIGQNVDFDIVTKNKNTLFF